jgi:hypothetical protein
MPHEERALHDIRLLFRIEGAWERLSHSSKYTLHPSNKDIKLEPSRSRDGKMELRIVVHHTDNIGIYVACSLNPVIANFSDLMRLSNELHLLEYRLEQELNQISKDAGIVPTFTIPHHMTWMCKSYHFGIDYLKEFSGDRFNVTYEDLNGAFVRVYAKQFPDKKSRLRLERLERPNLSLIEVCNDLLDTGNKAP